MDPVHTPAVVLYPGERADVLLRALASSRVGQSYPIRLQTLNGHTFEPGALKYTDSNGTAAPESPSSALNSLGVIDTANGTIVGSLCAHSKLGHTATSPDRVIELTLGGKMRGYEWWINGKRFQLPSVPLTVDPTAHGHVHVHGANVWDVRLGELVDVLVHNPTVSFV